ncbi:MAG: hypothetical protein Q7R95_03760, partial [bacterium]|nr:hypothetical protein [bacterium]
MGLFPFISSWIGRKNDKKKEPQRGLGVYSFKSKVYLYYTAKKSNVKFNVAESTDGFCFERTKKNQYLDGPRDIETYISKYHNFKISHISENSKNFSLYFQCISGSEKHQYLAYSNNLSHWTVSKTIKDFTETGALVSGYTYKKQFVMYYGEKNIHIAYSDNDYDWKTEKNPILTPRKNSFDNSEIEIQNAILTEKGVLIVYHSRSKRSNYVDYKIGLALFDAQNPSKLLWRSNEPVWDSTHEWRNKHISPIGVVLFQEKCISYWDIEGEGIYAVVYSFYKLHIPSITQHVSLNLKKSNSNPMISPNNNNWESFNTFNPATIYEGGKVHILYRAQGYNYVSTIGYATSNDGTTIDERLNYPVFTPDDHLKINKPIYNSQPNTNPYSSGGGFGGCEDPRITKIDDRIYMMYVANDGSLPRLALTSISVEDFLNRNWLWEKPILISPPGVV